MAFRKKILLLASKISLESGTYTGVTPSDPEYMIFDPVVTDEMADVGMHVKVRKPRRIEVIARHHRGACPGHGRRARQVRHRPLRLRG